MKILVLHLVMCNNGLKTFYPLVVMKITFFCYLLFPTCNPIFSNFIHLQIHAKKFPFIFR